MTKRILWVATCFVAIAGVTWSGQEYLNTHRSDAWRFLLMIPLSVAVGILVACFRQRPFFLDDKEDAGVR